MADAKITSLAALAADPANNDMFVIVDVSDTSMAATGTDKKLAASYLMKSSGASAGATSQAQAFTSGIVTGIVRPPSDSTTAFRVQNAAGTVSTLTVNTSANEINIGGYLNIRGSATLNNFSIGGGLANITTGNYNGAIGLGVMGFTTTGFNNVGIGPVALYSLISGGYNVGIGYAAVWSAVGGSHNLGI